MLNEQFMDGMTEMPEDEEINETMSKLAESQNPINGNQPGLANRNDQGAELLVDEKVLSQSLLETFEMGQDDQFENLLDDVEMDELVTQEKPIEQQ